MKSGTQALIAFFSAMAVTLVAVSDMRRTSPGELSAVHHRVPELSGRNDCSECHGGLFSTLREACLRCHEPIETQLDGLSGLHGTLGARAEQCGLCHAEHHGVRAPLVHGQSFALAGTPVIEDFDHASIGFQMDGAHLALDCNECHEHASEPILPEGAQRFLGLEQDCASCHEDGHEGEMALTCASCHGQETWDGLASQNHGRFLALVGPHALDCTECHDAEEPHALDILGRQVQAPGARDCAACHESPHERAFSVAVAEGTLLPTGQACILCHRSEHESFREDALADMSAEQHAASGFLLEAPHDVQQCADCHAPDEAAFAARYPGRRSEECSACHADVHEGQFDEGPFAGEECSACHEPLQFAPHAFGVEEHALAALELSGMHLEAKCEDCHQKPEDGARLFRGTPFECAACHEDAHDGYFEAYLEEYEELEHGECAHCHDPSGFADAAQIFDHGAFTRFEVVGAHAESACGACHAAEEEADASGRTFGRVAQIFGPFEGCATCHQDPHDGRFGERAGFPEQVEGQQGCARCHVESSFRTLPRGFDHGYWTGFVLAGEHGQANCTACHTPLPGASQDGRTTARAPGGSCSDCHEDPHAGQFTDHAGANDCSRCHSDGRADFLSFDHDQDSNFVLGEAHRSLECSACHPNRIQDGLQVIHFRPLNSECTDCHGTNAEVLLRRQPRKR